ncbi:MAG: ATP-dependent RecD-like DNA helicase [Deltaproteobacteria bacterium]|nr:ATP-dependent RecD-like DNA helicase [Deltaproteobacteria bacterium]
MVEESGRARKGERTIDATVERIVFHNESSGWTVVRALADGSPLVETVVGRFQRMSPGERVRFTGRWATDRRHGRQFEADTCLPLSPRTLAGIEKFIGSGLVPGIGPIMAGRIVKRFGLETLDVIESDPGRLAEVPGIGSKRAQTIRKAWVEKRAVKEVMIFLESAGVSPAFAHRIHQRYGHDAIRLVTDNPFRLASDVSGIGFLSADRIAEKLGIPRDSPHRAEAGVVYALEEMAGEGHVFARKGPLLETAERLLGVETAALEAAVERLVLMGDLRREGAGDDAALYLPRLHRAETNAARALTRILATPAIRIAVDADEAVRRAERLSGIALAAGQRRVFALLDEAKAVVLTGGPGTGKTTILRGLAACFVDLGLKVVEAAPTGRAARRMTEATGHEAKTLHRLLEWNPKSGGFERGTSNPLDADVIIVDEVSMVDVELFAALLEAARPAARLLFVGDPDQLPSVGPGTVLADLIELGRGGVRGLAVVRLTEIFRQAEASMIVRGAHDLLAGREPRTGERGEDADLFMIERREPQECLDVIKELVSERIPRRFGLDPVNDIQVLTPMHKGLLGATSLNEELQALLNPGEGGLEHRGRIFRMGDKIMQVRNNYELDVFNGDIGRVIAVDPDEGRLMVRFFDRDAQYEAADLDQLQLAYACSVHKSQGSEYPAVVIPIHTQHYVLLQRNLLYTAITRGKRLVVLVGTKRALGLAVRNSSEAERGSLLVRRVLDAAHAFQVPRAGLTR